MIVTSFFDEKFNTIFDSITPAFSSVFLVTRITDVILLLVNDLLMK